MCLLSIKVPIRKMSGNLFNGPCINIYIYIYICICWPTGVKVDPKRSFSIASTLRCRAGRYFFPGFTYP